MELKDKILNDFAAIPNIKTKDIDLYNKRMIKEKADVSELKTAVPDCPALHRTYFQVSLAQLDTNRDRFLFIRQNEDLLADWWQVDQLTQLFKKPVDFDIAFEQAKDCVSSEKTFTRRWGYVLFLMGLQKDKANTGKILSLMKNDEQYYVQMAEAWLLCDLAVFNTEPVLEFIENCGLDYNILGKAIQKICESYRISDKDKDYARGLRNKLKA